MKRLGLLGLLVPLMMWSVGLGSANAAYNITVVSNTPTYVGVTSPFPDNDSGCNGGGLGCQTQAMNEFIAALGFDYDVAGLGKTDETSTEGSNPPGFSAGGINSAAEDTTITSTTPFNAWAWKDGAQSPLVLYFAGLGASLLSADLTCPLTPCGDVSNVSTFFVTPIPAALPLLLTAIGGLFGFRWLRGRREFSAAA